jgi:hypothetical protein
MDHCPPPKIRAFGKLLAALRSQPLIEILMKISYAAAERLTPDQVIHD